MCFHSYGPMMIQSIMKKNASRNWQQAPQAGSERTANGPAYETSKPVPNDILPSASVHRLTAPWPSQTVTPSEDQVLKHRSLRGTFPIQTSPSRKEEDANEFSQKVAGAGWGWRKAGHTYCGPRSFFPEGGTNYALNKSSLSERMNGSHYHRTFILHNSFQTSEWIYTGGTVFLFLLYSKLLCCALVWNMFSALFPFLSFDYIMLLCPLAVLNELVKTLKCSLCTSLLP